MTTDLRNGWGWLRRREDLRVGNIDGIRLRADLPTRFEEFTFVRDVLGEGEGRLVLDAACGFQPGVHIMPELLAHHGWNVIALDRQDPSPRGVFNEPFASDVPVFRHRGDITKTLYRSGIFDAWICVSVLEHMSAIEGLRTLHEAIRLTKPGARLVLTMDKLDPEVIARVLETHCDVGKFRESEGQHLQPNVSYVVATRKNV